MNKKTSLLSHTKNSFASYVKQTLGKGFEHAGLLYEEWFRTGRLTGRDPAFNNAKALYENIVALLDLSVLPFLDKREEGNTGKFLLTTRDRLEIESVLIPMQAGGTLCVSSQVGCRMGCSFCETGRMGLLRNLTVEEIIAQPFVARFNLNFSVRNIVFMGMGEPFDNYDEVRQATRVLTDPNGLNFGFNHLTISTSGHVEGILKLMDETGPIPHLAVSINAPHDELRQKLMPITRQYPLSVLKEAMLAFCQKTGRSILIAYVLIKDVNDDLRYADELAAYLTGLQVKVNLIPYNSQSRDRYQAPDLEQVEAFMIRLRQLGYQTLLRRTKGQKIMAACGQLGNLQLKKLRPALKAASGLPLIDPSLLY